MAGDTGVASESEELRAPSEESLSSYEELQSTNEELQTAKEELQAANQELSTVNQALIERNREAIRLSDDLGNVLTSVSIAIVILGRDGRIRRFTPAAGKLLNLLATDVGRPLSDIKATFDVPDLTAMAADVVVRLVPLEHSVKDAGGRWYSLTMRPYVTLDNRVDGAVMSVVDVDALKTREQAMVLARDFAESIIETVHSGLLVLDEALQVRSVNRSFCQDFDLQREDVMGRRFVQVGAGELSDPILERAIESVCDGHVLDGFRFERELPKLGKRSFILNARRLERGTAHPGWLLLAIDDVTSSEREERERSVLESQETLRRMAFEDALSEDRERRRIATTLHDGVGQTLALAQMKAVSTRSRVDGEARANLDQCVTLIAEAIAQTRTVTFDLSPPILYDLGLEAALRWLAEQLETRYGIRVELAVDFDGAVDLAPEVATMVFRAVRELLTNVCKHSGSGAAQVTLARTCERLAITVEDAGVGFDASPASAGHLRGGFGLFSVREQIERLGGSVGIQSEPGKGAWITLTVPTLRHSSTPPSKEQSA